MSHKHKHFIMLWWVQITFKKVIKKGGLLYIVFFSLMNAITPKVLFLNGIRINMKSPLPHNIWAFYSLQKEISNLWLDIFSLREEGQSCTGNEVMNDWKISIHTMLMLFWMIYRKKISLFVYNLFVQLLAKLINGNYHNE